MDIILSAALVATILAGVWFLDRKDKRHDQQLSRLLVHVQAPDQAVARELHVPLDGPLYLPPEDDEAWHEHHGTGD